MVNVQSILRRLEVPQKEEEAEVWEQNKWLNRDNVPLPPSRRLWGFWAYAAFWTISGISVSGWAGGASMLALGLTVGQTMAVAVVGSLIIAFLIVLTGQVGAYWHVGFPMWNRAVWGLRLAYFPLANRIILSFTWSSTQAWFGGQCLKVMIGAMAPGIYTMKNTLPAGIGMTNADLMCFFLFLLITIPILLVPPEHLRYPLIVSASLTTPTCLIIFIWSLARAGGGGPLMKPEGLALVGVEPARGANLAWAIIRGISASIGGLCAGILNQSDFTRFAVRPRDPFVSQAIFTPLCSVICTIVGIVCASVGSLYYPGFLLWTPYDLLSAVQRNENTAGARAAVFFAAFVFTCAQLSLNITGNLIAGGIDLATVLPKYLNIRRGAYITLAISVAMNPWALLNGATAFINVMSGYSTFLGPVTGIMVFDYFFVRYRKVKLTALYDGSPTSIYWYWRGCNLRVPFAWVCGVAPLFPGFLQSVGAGVNIPLGMTKLYYLCYPFGFLTSGLVHVAISKIWPPDGVGEVDQYDVFGTFGEPEVPPENLKAESAMNEKHEKDVEANITTVVA